MVTWFCCFWTVVRQEACGEEKLLVLWWPGSRERERERERKREREREREREKDGGKDIFSNGTPPTSDLLLPTKPHLLQFPPLPDNPFSYDSINGFNPLIW
jgi:hypothetical protein